VEQAVLTNKENGFNSNPMQEYLAVSEGQGRVSDKEQCRVGGGWPCKGLIMGQLNSKELSHSSLEGGGPSFVLGFASMTCTVMNLLPC
jgi:hypothetical protein